MKTLDKAAVITLRAEIEAALQAVATKHGIVIKAGNGNYSGTNATLKLEISVVDASGLVVNKEVAAFQRVAVMYGFKPEDLGRSFTVRGKNFTLAGFDSKSRKFPILASCNGKMFKLEIDSVQRALGVPTSGLRDFGVSLSARRMASELS